MTGTKFLPRDKDAQRKPMAPHRSDISFKNYMSRKKVLFDGIGAEQVSQIEAKVRQAYDKPRFSSFVQFEEQASKLGDRSKMSASDVGGVKPGGDFGSRRASDAVSSRRKSQLADKRHNLN